jgi:hypothetical protein
METLRTETAEGVREIVLCRAAAYNTITPALRDELAAAIRRRGRRPRRARDPPARGGPRVLRGLCARLGDRLRKR